MNYNNTDQLQNYIKAHCAPESNLLKKLNRATHLKILRPRMLSGHVQGRILSMLSQMIAPQSVFEIGTYTGYSALCLAEGLQAGGKLITCDINDEIESFTRSFFSQSEMTSKIEYYIEDARQLLNRIDKQFDLVFIDGDKRQYPEYYELVIKHTQSGGYIVADNILWNGKVADESQMSDPYTRGVAEFNKRVLLDERVDNVILPVRDGLMICRKH